MILRNKGFTLTELSVVLVIIGLLIGASLTGISLIRSAEIREVIGEYDRYAKAIKEFQDKYQAIPGDMNNAEDIWGSDATCPTTATNTVFKIATCNGDGDGRIGASNTNGFLYTANMYEWFRAWQQLSNAGLIDTKFTGVKKSATNGDAGIGLNVPQSKLSVKSGWTLFYLRHNIASVNLWGDNYGHIFFFGGETGSVTHSPVLSPENAYAIDQKIDDGTPGRGNIRARRTSPEPNCTINDTTQDAAAYNATSTTDLQCSLIFILGF